MNAPDLIGLVDRRMSQLKVLWKMVIWNEYIFSMFINYMFLINKLAICMSDSLVVILEYFPHSLPWQGWRQQISELENNIFAKSISMQLY